MTRHTEFRIDPLFTERWSRRAFSGEAIDLATLYSLFEAARWAPSGGNTQPWRFVYARQGTDAWPRLFDLLDPRNQRWSQRAAALVALLSKKTRVRDGSLEPTPLRSHSFDAGAAWISLAFEALGQGWTTRAIGGFDRQRARDRLEVPDDYEIEVLIAIGKPADAQVLPEDLREQERPNGRKPLRELVAEGRFSFDAA